MNTYQALGQNIDVVLMFGFGLLAVVCAERLVGKEGTGEEITRKTKLFRRCGMALIILAPLILLMKTVD